MGSHISENMLLKTAKTDDSKILDISFVALESLEEEAREIIAKSSTLNS